VLAGLAAHVGASPGDCAFIAAGETTSSRALLAAARLEVGRRCGLIDESQWSFVWVVDAPLFEPAGDAAAAERRRDLDAGEAHAGGRR
jgi:aspartyl-tRNA synthetase